MANSQIRAVCMTAALFATAVLVLNGFKAYQILVEKASAQREKTEILQRFRGTYKAAEESKKKFDHEFSNADVTRTIPELLRVVNFEQYNIETDVDNVVVKTAEPVVVGDTPIGVVRACLTTGVADGGTLFVRAPNYSTLLAGYKKLSSRTDVEIGNVSLFGNGPFPLLKFGTFCVLLRQS